MNNNRIKNRNKLLVFTRSPVLGEVKTRMQPVFTAEQSLKLHKHMLQNTLSISEKLTNIDVELCCSPNRNTLFFLECENRFPITLSNQQGDDLGERMAFSFSVALQSYDKVVIVGTDCPELDEDYIEQAVKALDDVDVVIGPAADGGYVLMGLRKFSLKLFSDLSWGSDTVLAQTKNIINELSWSYKELGILHDVDRPEDLHRYQYLLNEII